ncbi:phosphate acetyltransferase [Candidatus Providencia siddallii]
MLIPIGNNVGLTSITLGLIHLIRKDNREVNFFKPIDQPDILKNKDYTTELLKKYSYVKILTKPLSIEYVKSLLTASKKDFLMERIVSLYYKNTKTSKVTFIEGLKITQNYFFLQSLNQEIAKILGAKIIFVTTPENNNIIQFKERLKLIKNEFGGQKNKKIIGVIINKINAPIDKSGQIRTDIYKILNHSTNNKTKKFNTKELFNINLPILASIPWNLNLIAMRSIDIAKYLNAEIINKGEIKTRRIKSIIFCTNNTFNIKKHFKSESLLITSSDRLDILFSALLAEINGFVISAILLTDGFQINKSIKNLYSKIIKSKLPIFKVNNDIWQTSINLQNLNIEVPIDDHKRIKNIKKYISSYINNKLINSEISNIDQNNKNLSALTFRYQLTELAKKLHKRIIFPEGDEPRILKATSICTKRGIATCVLLGNPDNIKKIADSQNIELSDEIEIIDPITIRKKYIDRLIELRKNKGMTKQIANKQIEDNVVLGTLMLEKGEVDGLVSGVVHTTANTIRPSLQLIKTASDKSLVSSIFFMLLPEQVYVYGDCAINPDPTAEQLSEIAIQSSDSAKAFGIDPRVAMISYSTGNSGKGTDVDKVRKATNLVKKKRPDIIIDGPLQYDAAAILDVAKSKAPNSPVAGKATVFIFPDLNTGNTTYKAVQRSANLISIGPMLQGMRKPVNDLSRGALVDDIIYTVALTVIQASHLEKLYKNINF